MSGNHRDTVGRENTWVIRPAEVQDAPQIAKIWAPVIQNTLITFNSVVKSSDEVARMIGHAWDVGHGFWVAQEVGKHPPNLGGFVTYGQFRNGIGYARTMEHTIIVDESTRGHGLGMQLIETAIDHARRAGVHSMWAGVSAENPAGVAFHSRAGFETVARLPQVGRKFDQWLDLILMQKILKPS